MSFESARVALHTIAKTFHDTSYATTQVNYPGRWLTDVEQTTSPFVQVEWSMSQETYGLPTNLYAIKGEVLFTYFARKNSGQKIFSDYLTNLSNYMSMKTISGVTFFDIHPYFGSGIPGFDSVTATISYEVQYSRP